MLLGIFSTVSAAGAALLCWLTGSFETWTWLWLLPATFLGGFLFCLILWFLFLLVLAKTVDMEAEQEEDSHIRRVAIDLSIRAIVKLLRIHIHTRGLEQLPKDGRFLLVCNHMQIVDPVVLLWAFPKQQLAFISKRENDSMFLFGPLLRGILCQPINRENDREALKTILKCIRLIKEDKVSIGVFPEGYIYDDHLLHPFRSGVFKIAQKAGVPVVVCTLQNTLQVFDNMKALRSSNIELHLVGVISVEAQQGRTAVDIAQEAHAMMAADLGPEKVFQEKPEEL